MKKIVLLFVLFFCSNAFSGISGIAYTGYYSDATEKILDDIDNSFTLILSSWEGGIKASSSTISGSGDFNKFYLKLLPGAKLLNKDDSTLTIASNITVVMQGSDSNPAVIHSRNKNLTIDGNLEIQGFSVISSSGEDGKEGTFHGEKDEQTCGNCDNYDDACSIDNQEASKRAKPGGHAGVLLIKNVLVRADVNFSASGGNGGKGAFGWNDDCLGGHNNLGCDWGDDQAAIRGGNGKDGGNANKIEIENLVAESGIINLNAFGGNGGKGGKGGNNSRCGDAHDGGDGGDGGNSMEEIKILNLTNSLAEINAFFGAGKGGSWGDKGSDDGGNCGCNASRGKKGVAGKVEGTDFTLTNSSGFVPWKIFGAENISITAKPFEYLDFAPQTEFTAAESIQITGCRLRGDAMKGFGSEEPLQVFLSGKTLDFNVFNPLKFYDRVEMNFTEGVTHHKNEECNLASERKEMILPFNGRIKGVDSGTVKDIEIINIVSQESEFEDAEERPFSNGNFSTEITASLYPNTFYLIKFTACSSSECQDFEFKFFTWKRLW